MDLERCIKLIENAKTDNEKMAALMLVAKLVNSSDIGADGRKKVFDAVGFSFINRLMATNKPPEGCTENPYHKIAVTILACFCTDPDLVIHPQITSKIPTFNTFILEQLPQDAKDKNNSSTVASESLHCLQALSSSKIGILHLLRHKTPESLAKVITTQASAVEPEAAKDLLLYVLGDAGAQGATNYHTTASNVLSLLAKEFNATQDELKFTLCDILYSVLSLSGELLLQSMESVSTCSTGWLSDIGGGLQAILTSRIDPARKNKAIHLAAMLTHLLGVSWAVETNIKFFMILVNLVSVELRISTEGQEMTQIVENSPLLCSYFIILESSVIYICQQSDLAESNTGCVLSQGDLSQLHTTLTEAFTCVIHILQTLRESFSREAASSAVESVESLTTAAVRVLGAWLAEETLALSSDVYRLLPFLLELCQHRLTQQAEDDKDLLKFLLPGLSHLTAEDKPRKVLLNADFQKLLLAYMQHLVPLHQTSSELSGRLALCCEVMINVCITESEAVKTDETFTSIAVLSLLIMKENECSRLSLSAALLSLLIVRRQGLQSLINKIEKSEQMMSWHRILDLLVHAVKLYPHASTVSHQSVLAADVRHCQWSDISELWFLAMQELSALVTHCQQFGADLLQVASEGSVQQQFADVLRSLVQLQSSDDECESISSAIGSILPQLAPSTS